MVNCSGRWRLRRLRSRHSAVADEEPTLPRRLDELIDLKMEAQNTHKEGKRNFDKKKWRETQYSHKQRVSEWESKRKEAVKRKYRKMLKKDESTSSVHITNRLYNIADGNYNSGYSQPPPPQRLSEFQRAKLEYERIQGLKEEARLEREQKVKEREMAIMKSKQVRLERIKKLTQKTKKGQPVMKGRIEILLEKIQKQVANES